MSWVALSLFFNRLAEANMKISKRNGSGLIFNRTGVQQGCGCVYRKVDLG
jgi:hypothetical protein